MVLWQAPRASSGLHMALDGFVQDKLDSIARTHRELTERLGDPDIIASPQALMQVLSCLP
jgi:hypothetical protein